MIDELKEIINGGFCNGCGNCSIKHQDTFEIKIDSYGKFSSHIIDNVKYKEINDKSFCPYTSSALNENQLVSDINGKSNKFIGEYLATYAGYIKDEKLREKATSGGIITWIASLLLKRNDVDGVIHVKRVSDSDMIVEYGFSHTIDEVVSAGRSAYYPVTPNEVIKKIISENNDKKYVFIGLPCMIKSLKIMMSQDELLKNKIPYTIGLVCGHLKTVGYTNYFASKENILPSKLKNIDFREKTDGGGASSYSIKLSGEDEDKIVPTKNYLAANWQYNTFRYSSCNFCDDIFAELSDITVGDAWIEPYISQSQGVSEIIVRNEYLNNILLESKRNDEIFIEDLSVSKVVRSQLGGLRDRREGLSYRLFNYKKNNKWVPKKRVSAKNILSKKRRKIYLLRMLAEKQSNDFFKNDNSLSGFEDNFRYITEEINFFNRNNKYISIIEKVLFLLNPNYDVRDKK